MIFLTCGILLLFYEVCNHGKPLLPVIGIGNEIFKPGMH